MENGNGVDRIRRYRGDVGLRMVTRAVCRIVVAVSLMDTIVGMAILIGGRTLSPLVIAAQPVLSAQTIK